MQSSNVKRETSNVNSQASIVIGQSDASSRRIPDKDTLFRPAKRIVLRDDASPSSVAMPSVVRPQSFGMLALIVVVMFALLALLTLGWVQRTAPPLENGMAPAFELTTFEGQTIKLADLRGKAVVINFWASWQHVVTQHYTRGLLWISA